MAKVNKMSDWSLLYLRLVLGFVFLYHGYTKLFVAGGFKGTVDFFTTVGIPMAKYSALAVALAEFAGGIFLILGILTMYSSLILMFVMAVAFFYIHMKNGVLVSQGGFEFVITLFASLLMVAMNNAGKFALGGKLKNKNLR